MASGSPDREPPGAAEIPAQDLPKGRLGGAPILLQQGRAHDGPESDTTGEARSAGAQEAQGTLKLGNQRSAPSMSGVEEGVEVEGREGRGDPRSRVGEDAEEDRRARDEAREGGRPRADPRAAPRTAARETSRSPLSADEDSPGVGKAAGAGGSQAATLRESQQAIEQWLAGLSADARELLRQEFRRNYERARPNTEGKPPW